MGYSICLIVSWWTLVTVISQWTDGMCGQCQCYKTTGQYNRIEYTANCTRMGLVKVPDHLPSNIHILDLSYNFLGNTSLNALEMFGETLTFLSLAYNNISHIDDSAFYPLTNLDSLDLTGNLLDYVDEKLLFSLNLRTLVGIQAKRFQSNSFQTLIGIESLVVLFEQDLIPEDVFKTLHIIRLEVTFQNAREIPNSLFRFGLNTLTTLSIFGPQLVSLPNDIFNGLSILKTLTIQGNNIRSLQATIFDESPLYLYKIRIGGVKSIPRDLLQKQRNLKFVTLNNIEDIPPLNFPDQLDCLDLSESHIYKISSTSFSNLYNLRKLNLSNTSLTSIDNNDLRGLHSLSSLDLSRNSIANVSTDIFKACRNTLDSLSLSYNKIQTISKSYFSSVKSLRHLDLNFNRIKYIAEDSFDSLRMLSSLFIVGNLITYLPENSFSSILSLEVIDLSYNEISTVSPTIFMNSHQLSSINLDQNPLHCDCGIILIRMDHPRVNIQGVCKSPIEYSGHLLKHLKINRNCFRFRENFIKQSKQARTFGVFEYSKIYSKTTPSFIAVDKDLQIVTEIHSSVKEVTTSDQLKYDVTQTQLQSTEYSTDPLSLLKQTSVVDVQPSSIYSECPSSEISEKKFAYIIVFSTVAIVAIVVLVTLIVGFRALFDKFKRSGTYILPPPKSEGSLN